MIIEQNVWGVTPEGEAVIIYTMKNALGSEVQLSNIGAGIVSVKYADRNGKIDDVVLGYKDPMSYFGDSAASGKTVGRVANRIAHGMMTIEGVEYRLEVNSGGNHLNGGTKGFANRLWESRVETNRVVFSFVSEDGDQGYPHELTVEVIYDFDDENNLEITYLAKSDGTTAVNLSNNVYWNLAGESSGSVLDHELKLNAKYVLESDERQIPTGRPLPMKGSAQDFTDWNRLGKDIGSIFNHIDLFRGHDHYFVVDGWQKNILGEVGELRCEKTGRLVKVLSSQPGCTVYTGNWLAGGCPITKSGNRYEDYAGVAIACQAHPNAVNNPDFPSILLHEGELYCNKIVFQLRTY